MSDDVRLASRWRRLGATAIDAVLVPAVSFLLVMVTGVVEHAEDFVDNTWMLHVLALAIASYLLLNGVSLWRRGQTLGKALLGISVRSAEDPANPAPFWKLVAVRAWFFALLFVVIVPWFALLPLVDQLLIFRKNRRCLHDLVAGTIVVRN